jgi:hypothetical protein
METAQAAEEYERESRPGTTNRWQITGISRKGEAGASILPVASLECAGYTSCLHF